MADNETIADIIAEARDKYTVHDCNECEYRKSCDLNPYGFDVDECREKRQSIALMFGIQDEYFTKLLCRLEAAWEREISKVIYAYDPTKAVKSKAPDPVAYALEGMKNDPAYKSLYEQSQPKRGDCAKLREALCFLIENEHTLFWADLSNGELELLQQIVGKARAALAAPPRNCDLARDWMRDLYAHFQPPASVKREMPPEWVDAVMAFCRWLIAPATEQEGGNDGNK